MIFWILGITVSFLLGIFIGYKTGFVSACIKYQPIIDELEKRAYQINKSIDHLSDMHEDVKTKFYESIKK